MKLRPYQATRKVIDNYIHNECEIGVTFGMPEGIGKSAYDNHVLADAMGWLNCHEVELHKWIWEKEKPEGTEVWQPDWEAAKRFIQYPPVEVVDLCLDMIDNRRKAPLLIWDDAGTWLNAMDFQDPFVIAFMKYLSLARSNWGMVILSTPVEEWVLRKLRTARGIYHIEVKRMPGTDRRYKFRPRLATAYKARKYKGNPRTYFPKQWQDTFMAIMPDSFFSWYEVQRRRYTSIAVQLMKQALDRRRRKGFIKQVDADEKVLQTVEKGIAEGNEKAAELEEATANLPLISVR